MSGMRTTRQRRRGFTLIELLIVISIILVILAIAVPKMNKQMQGAREMAVIREIGSIHQAETQYYSQFGKFAVNLDSAWPAGKRCGRARSGQHHPENPGGREEERIHLHADRDTQRICDYGRAGFIWKYRQPDVLLRSDPGHPQQLGPGTRYARQPGNQIVCVSIVSIVGVSIVCVSAAVA